MLGATHIAGTGYDRVVPRGEPKVMFAVRLPGPLREAIRERAEEDGVAESQLVEEWLQAGLEAGPEHE